MLGSVIGHSTGDTMANRKLLPLSLKSFNSWLRNRDKEKGYSIKYHKYHESQV